MRNFMHISLINMEIYLCQENQIQNQTLLEKYY